MNGIGGCWKADLFPLWCEAEGTGYAAASVSSAVTLAGAGSPFTYGIRAPGALGPDTAVVVCGFEGMARPGGG